MKKKYVLVLITVMDRAGAETMMMNYLRNIDREKIQMDFLINRPDRADYEDEIEQLGSRVYHMCSLYPGKFRKYKKEFRKFLMEHPEYTIIHSHLEERSYFALKIARQMGIPVRIVHAHSVPKHFNLKLPVRLYFRWRLKGTYTHRFACSKEPAKWLYGTDEMVELAEVGDGIADGSELLNCAGADGHRPVVLMKNAIDTDEFSFDAKTRKEMRKKLKIKDGTIVIGHVGRFIYEKNQNFLVDIFEAVSRQQSDCRLLLIGGGKPKEEIETKEAVKKKVKELGLSGKVKFLGVRDDVAGLMQAMDILVMPSISEGFPVTLVEAQSVGIRCLASDTITYGCNVTGELQYLSLEQDVIEWANKILSFCTTDLDAAEMNHQVKDAGFDIRENAKWLEEFYERC